MVMYYGNGNGIQLGTFQSMFSLAWQLSSSAQLCNAVFVDPCISTKFLIVALHHSRGLAASRDIIICHHSTTPLPPGIWTAVFGQQYLDTRLHVACFDLATCNMQTFFHPVNAIFSHPVHATCFYPVHATYLHPVHASYLHPVHATYLLIPSPCYLLPPGPCYLLPPSPCYMLLATCYLLHATCYMLHATCYMLLATYFHRCFLFGWR
jgi:hypothetical protein